MFSVAPEDRQEYETNVMQDNVYLDRGYENDTTQLEQPSFRQAISCNNPNVAEGERTRFVGEVSPAKDSTIQIEWLKDGQPIVIGRSFYDAYLRHRLSSEILHLCDFPFMWPKELSLAMNDRFEPALCQYMHDWGVCFAQQQHSASYGERIHEWP